MKLKIFSGKSAYQAVQLRPDQVIRSQLKATEKLHQSSEE